MRSSSVLTVASAALLAIACSESSSGGAGPVVTSVEPASGYASAPVEVTIHGRNFAIAAVQPSGGGDPIVRVPRVLLGAVELTPVTWVDNSTLRATVPQGLATGAYSVTVIDGHGAASAALAGGFTVLSEGQLSATLAVDHAAVNVGRSFTVTLTLTNNGGTDVTDLAFGDPTVTGSAGGTATLSGPGPTPPATLAAGAQTTASWTCQATAAGRVSVNVTATGRSSGTTLTAVPPAPAVVTIQTPASLIAAWTARSLQTTAQPVTVTLVLTNAAGAATAHVTAVTPTSTPSATCGAVTPAASAAAPVAIAGGTFASFSWECTATVTAQTGYTFNATLAAVDVNSGLAVTPALNGVQVTYTPNPTLGVTVTGNGAVGSTVASVPPGITACSSTGGTGCSAQFAAGTQVTLTATPRAGASVAWTGPLGSNPCAANPTANSCRVVISGTANNEVTATFTLAQFNVVVAPASANGGTGSVTSNIPTGATAAPVNACAVSGAGAVSGTCTGAFDFGTTVVLTAAPGNAGTTVTWAGCDAAAGGVVDVVAHTCTFANIQAAKNVTATFALSQETLTVNAPTNGTIQCGGAACAASYAFGTTVTLTASPAPGFSFGAWTGACAGQATATCSLTMDGAKVVGASFTANAQGLTLASTPPGIGATFTCNGGACNATYPTGTALVITATAPGYTFTAFSGACTGATCSFNMPANATSVTATFTAANQGLTLASTPPGIGATFTCNGGACNPTYATGTALTVAASAPGYTLNGFSGACTGATCTFNMPATGATVTASFTPVAQPLSLGSTPTGIGATFSCNGGACNLTYPTGTALTVAATAPGYTLNGFSGACSGATCTFNMPPTGAAVTASFTAALQPLTRTSSPAGAPTILCNGGACQQSYATGTPLTLSAPNGSGFVFAGWAGTPCSGTGDCSFSMPAGGVSVTANYDFQVTVAVTGQLGNVTAPGGINCPDGGVCSGTFTGTGGGAVTSVTLTATLGLNSTGVIWSWPTAGNPCSPNNNLTCTVDLPVGVTVTATFQ